VPVTLTVTAPPAITIQPSAVNFTYLLGGSSPPAQTVALTGNTGTVGFTAAASPASGWLALNSGSGTTPATLSLSVNPAGLNPGVYNGAITVNTTGSNANPQTIAVTLTIQASSPAITGVMSAASLLSGPLAPGEIVMVRGANLGPSSPANLTIDATGKVATAIGGVQVLVNGVAAPLLYASATQINAVVPYDLARAQSASVVVQYLGVASNAWPMAVAGAAPGLFAQNGQGTGKNRVMLWIS
jgi:hypothetical protein